MKRSDLLPRSTPALAVALLGATLLPPPLASSPPWRTLALSGQPAPGSSSTCARATPLPAPAGG